MKALTDSRLETDRNEEGLSTTMRAHSKFDSEFVGVDGAPTVQELAHDVPTDPGASLSAGRNVGMEDFENLLRTLMSPENASRGLAEQAYEKVKLENPGMLLSCLGQTVRSCADPTLKAFSAVLLRRCAPETINAAATSDDARELVKSSLLGSLQEETERSIRTKVADTTGTIAFHLMNPRPDSGRAAGTWDELIPFLVQCCQSPSASHRESGLSIIGGLAQWLGDKLAPQGEAFKAIFAACLADPGSGQVRLAAIEATCKFLPSLPDHALFADLLVPMVQVVTTALGQGDEATARAALEHLIELVEDNNKFLRARIADISAMALQVCGTDTLDEGTRQLGMEFLVSVSEKSPGLVRKMNIVESLIPMCMQFMLTIEDDDEWETNDSGFEEDEDSELYTAGEDALYRISVSIGGNTVLPVLTGLVGGFVAHADWRNRLVGLMSVCQATEGCSKQLSDNLQDVVGVALARFTDDHPRVRHAALHTLGTMAADFGPDLQEQFHQPILTGLATLMQDSSVRVQAHAAAALLNFCDCQDDDDVRERRAEVMAPYLDGLLARLQGLLSSSRKVVLDNAIQAVAAVSSVMGDQFAPYYDMFMPFLKNVVAQAISDDLRLVRAKAIECISLVGLAVGKEKFAPDAHDVMVMMSQTQFKGDDPQTEYIVNAWPRICKCLGPDFVPYLEHVMPLLLESAAKKPDVQMQDADQGEMEGMENLLIGDKMIGIRTSDMEEKKNACMALARFVEHLQEHFYPYIEKTATIMLPLLKFFYHEDVRLAAAFSMPEFVKCCLKHAEATGGDLAISAQLTNVIYNNLVQCIPDEPQVDVQMAMLEALQETIESGAKVLGPEHAPTFLASVPRIWTEIKEQQAEKQAQLASNEDCDAEELAALEEQTKCFDEVHEWVGHCVGAFFKAHKDAFLPHFLHSGLPEPLLQMLTQEVKILKKVGMWVWTDMVDNCPAAAAQYAAQIVPPMLSCADMSLPADIRTAAAYGLGVCAAKLGPAAAPFGSQIMSALLGLLRHPEARMEGNEDATDNVVSALGKVCLHQSVEGAHAVLPEWLSHLPLKSDLEEAAQANEQLVALHSNSPRTRLALSTVSCYAFCLAA